MKFFFQAIVPLLALVVGLLNWLHPYNPVKNSPLHPEEAPRQNKDLPTPTKPETKPIIKKPGPVPSPLVSGNYREPLTGIEFVCLPKGCYKMGCGSWNDEPR